MDKRNLLNLVMLITLGLLGLLAWLGTDRDQGPALLLKDAPQAAMVSDILVTWKGQRRHFVRDADGWRITEPLAVAANQVQVEKMLELLQVRSDSEFSVSAAEMDKFGFGAQALQVEMAGQTIRFGTTEPLHSRRYVSYRDHIHIISRDIHYLFNMPVERYISPRLLPDGTRLLSIAVLDGTLALEEGNWVAKPARQGIAGDRITRFLDEWRYASAMEVSHYEPAEGKEVVIGTEQGEVRFRVHHDGNEYRLGRPDLNIQYHLPADVGDKLLYLARAGQDDTSAEGMPAAGKPALSPASNP